MKRYNPEEVELEGRASGNYIVRGRMVRAKKGRWCRMQDVKYLLAIRDAGLEYKREISKPRAGWAMDALFIALGEYDEAVK